jgi:antitoxin (DNA-binding transcriptional repressor) of toxin-antitoxin stability system
MSTAENAKLQYEAGQNAVAMSALTDSGDHTSYTSAATLWSGRSGYAPVVRPNGLLTGGVSTKTAVNNQISVAALTCNLAGVVTSVSTGTITITRPATAVAKINSITVTSAGALAMVAGTDSTTTDFSETRAAAGGPPLIPTGSIELGQVRVISNSAAPITDAEIFQVVGLHQERADFPLYDVNYGSGKVTFLAENPLIHTGPVSKAVYASYASPIFADVALASDFVPPETSHSVTSTQVYGTTIGSTSSTLNQGTFTAYLQNGVGDPLVSLKNAILWFRFYPDRYAADYILSQGKLGIARTFPAGDQIQATCTISASAAATEVA